MNIAIIGSGSWGIALAVHLAKLGNNIKTWAFLQEEADSININKKCKLLPNIVINENIKAYTNLQEVVKDSELIIHVTPSKNVRETIKKYKEFVNGQPIIMCSKGIENNTFITLNEVVAEEIPNVKYGVLSGPSHAEEVAKSIPTAMVIASKDSEICNLVQNIFMNKDMRIYSSDDVVGVEIGGALKNIIAFCAGMLSELKLGDNTFAALLTRGLAEIKRLGIAMGAKQHTFYGLSGLGDLIATGMSQHSRNRKAGILIGKGYSIEEAKKEVGMVIESIDNIEVAYNLSKKYNADMPIVNAVYNILHNGLDPKEAVDILMTRERKIED